MAQIKSEAAYRAAMKRIDELLKVVNDSTPADDPSYLELDMISDMVKPNSQRCLDSAMPVSAKS